MKWRLGKCRQDIYAQAGAEPSEEEDVFLGSFNTPEDAATAVEAVNRPYRQILAERDRWKASQ